MNNLVQTLSGPGRGRQRGLVPEIVQAISHDIRAGAIAPGEKLPSEAELMARFSVSRTVVREAISRLQASDMVETRHGIGTFAKHVSEQATFRIAPEDFSTVADVISLLELRISLETEAAGLAASRRSEHDLERIAAALKVFHQAIQETSDAVPADFQFHLEVARATGNRHFEDLMTYLGTMIIPRTRINTANAAPEGRLAYLQRVHGEHENIYEAIRAGDADSARAAMRTHLSNSRERLRRSQNQDSA
ncbi:FadR family transcriptional regulator [Curvibacter sp. CHRR-16]|uniref:FadR/GntR family transcriptional regulator n=1 Tax=Curvibacter sp. CHRR-16 TaxID=2835872 RepID=UPI001BDA9999|nr:FadR/GntR family transcriptional regulator [Curvibacter sp. CHRR-16]MBT0570128.1 FadR family transcriptional regulator [Curvibacter sp. CHRR-16]